MAATPDTPDAPPARIAVLADVHGNLPALEAVVADLARRGADAVVNLGDHASGPLWPRETVELLMRQPWTQIAGNCDRAVARRDPELLGPSDRFARERLDEAQLAWLAALPAGAVVAGELRLCHGTPADDEAYLLEEVARGGTRLARPAEVAARLGGVAEPVVACGHSHVPRIVRAAGTLVLNPGSVGLPAYEHDAPPHVMESGSPDARYALLERGPRGWAAELVAVPYDHEGAAARAERSMRPDWAIALRTGFTSR